MTDSAGKIILLTGGGSGGHVYPLLAVAEELKSISEAQGIELELVYMGPSDAYSEILREAGIEARTIVAGKLRRYLSAENIIDIPKFFFGFFEALFKLFWIMPDVIFSKGGTGALPVVIAGSFYGIPVMIHDSDAIPGLTNIVSGHFATRVGVSFEKAMKYFNPKETARVGTPVRKVFFDDRTTAAEAKESLGFDPAAPLVFVLGGSQGSERINSFIVTNLADLLKETQILHQTGQGNFREVERLSHAALTDLPVKTAVASRYKPLPYLNINDMKAALTAADLVVGRAGSNTIAEVSAFGKPAILIPLQESARDHQRINAYEFAEAGAAAVIEEPNLVPGIFLAQVRSIIGNPAVLQKMSDASAKFFKPGAARVIAQEILKMAG